MTPSSRLAHSGRCDVQSFEEWSTREGCGSLQDGTGYQRAVACLWRISLRRSEHGRCGRVHEILVEVVEPNPHETSRQERRLPDRGQEINSCCLRWSDRPGRILDEVWG